MTGPLRNARWERFCVALAEGRTGDEAYEIAGFQKNRGNAARLKATEAIRNRLAELQEVAAKDNAITIQSICAELDAANTVARAKGQASAMISAAALRAKLGGLMVDKVEVGQPGAFDKCLTIAEIVDDLLFYENPNLPVTDDDRHILEQMFKEAFATMQAFIDGLKARMIDMPATAYSQRRIELQRPAR